LMSRTISTMCPSRFGRKLFIACLLCRPELAL
jgi:hypothetical protein